MDKWAALLIGEGGILAGQGHLWDDRHPTHYERTYVVRASTLEASELHRRSAWLEKNEVLEKLAEVTKERNNLRLRIQAVDKEHEQLAIDRQKMKDGYNKLLNELLEREMYGDNKLA